MKYRKWKDDNVLFLQNNWIAPRYLSFVWYVAKGSEVFLLYPELCYSQLELFLHFFKFSNRNTKINRFFHSLFSEFYACVGFNIDQIFNREILNV